MNVGHGNTWLKANLSIENRASILALIELDQRTAERVVRLPEIGFIKRELPGERQWARERLEQKILE